MIGGPWVGPRPYTDLAGEAEHVEVLYSAASLLQNILLQVCLNVFTTCSTIKCFNQ